MASLIIPKTYVEQINKPVIFLAGPIKGASNWQDKAILYLISKDPDVILVSPRRGIRDEIAPYIIKGNETHFQRQRMWERYYLECASKKGAIMFWFPGEIEHDCNKSYGAMTRFESGMILGWYKYDKSIEFCLGSDGKFSELDTMLVDFKLDAPEKRVFPTLEQTCDEALRIAYAPV